MTHKHKNTTISCSLEQTFFLQNLGTPNEWFPEIFKNSTLDKMTILTFLGFDAQLHALPKPLSPLVTAPRRALSKLSPSPLNCFAQLKLREPGMHFSNAQVRILFDQVRSHHFTVRDTRTRKWEHGPRSPTSGNFFDYSNFSFCFFHTGFDLKKIFVLRG